MKCFQSSRSKTLPPQRSSGDFPSFQPTPATQQNTSPTQEILLRVPGCTVHLMLEGEAIELDRGEFTLVRITDSGIPLATIIKVGEELQWPLTKDEPVVKLDSLHCLFSLMVNDGAPLSYGVTFSDQSLGYLGRLDSFLNEHACFSTAGAASGSTRKNNLDWKEFAPRIDDYNNVLAKAIATGTGHIVKGIFTLSNAYTNQVQKGGEMMQTRTVEVKNGVTSRENNSTNRNHGARNKSGVNKGLKRVKTISKTTEKMSKSMLDVVGVATGSVMAPLMRSQAGKKFCYMVPGQVLLASLDALNKVIDAAEAAQKQTLTATSGYATRAVGQRFGEGAGEATGDTLATAGHCANTAWNVFKIRKAITPSSTASNGALRNADKIRKAKY